MKTMLVFLCAVTLVFGVVGVAGAVPISFTDSVYFYEDSVGPDGTDLISYGGDDVNMLEGFLDHVAWTHNFVFDPAAQEILTGELTLALRDDECDPWYFPWEIGVGVAEDGTWDLGEVNTDTYDYDVTVSYLADGHFTVLLASLGGDFYIDEAHLNISYNPVPEPATMLLLGSGLVGLAGLGRKKFFKK